MVSVAPNVSTLQCKLRAITTKNYLIKSAGNALQQKEYPDKTLKQGASVLRIFSHKDQKESTLGDTDNRTQFWKGTVD